MLLMQHFGFNPDIEHRLTAPLPKVREFSLHSGLPETD